MKRDWFDWWIVFGSTFLLGSCYHSVVIQHQLLSLIPLVMALFTLGHQLKKILVNMNLWKKK